MQLGGKAGQNIFEIYWWRNSCRIWLFCMCLVMIPDGVIYYAVGQVGEQCNEYTPLGRTTCTPKCQSRVDEGADGVHGNVQFGRCCVKVHTTIYRCKVVFTCINSGCWESMSHGVDHMDHPGSEWSW